MITSIENQLGIISYDTSLMDQILNEALSNQKGNYKLLKKDYFMEEEGLVVAIDVALKFGTSINNFSNEVITKIAERVDKNLDLTCKSIRLHINAVYSKKVARRDILIEYDGKSGVFSIRD